MTEDERIAEEVFDTMDGKVKCKECGEWRNKSRMLLSGVCGDVLCSRLDHADIRLRVMGDFGMKIITPGPHLKLHDITS